MEDHKLQYEKLIIIAQSRCWTNDTAPCYVENHHILPKSMCGTNNAENLVFLTAIEHFYAHYHLAKWHNTPKLAYVLSMLTGVASSKETKQQMQNAWVDRELIKCPHCDKVEKPRGMTRYHFDNCKFKEVNKCQV